MLLFLGFFLNSAKEFCTPCSMSHASSSRWRSPDADREIKRKMEHRSERTSSVTEQMFAGMLTLCLAPYLWRCHPAVKWVTEEGRIKAEGEEGETTGRRRGESSVVGRTPWKKCWQAGCSMTGKWDSHTAVFWRRGTPEIGVGVFHCQGGEWERETLEDVMSGETEKMDRDASKKKKDNKRKEKVRHTLERLLLY